MKSDIAEFSGDNDGTFPIDLSGIPEILLPTIPEVLRKVWTLVIKEHQYDSADHALEALNTEMRKYDPTISIAWAKAVFGWIEQVRVERNDFRENSPFVEVGGIRKEVHFLVQSVLEHVAPSEGRGTSEMQTSSIMSMDIFSDT